MDFKRFLQAVLQHRALVILICLIGLGLGVGYTFLSPPLLSSNALVELSSPKFLSTQVYIAESPQVLVPAGARLDEVKVSTEASNLLQITGKGATAAQAEHIANAVAASYLAYISSPEYLGPKITGFFFEHATFATGKVTTTRVLDGVFGLLIGVVAGVIIAMALSSGDRRLRERDEIADAIGVPVLASIPVQHPSDTAGWLKLLDGYEPEVVHAWSMRK